MQRIAVLTSGGDAPGMNAAIRAVVRKAIYLGLEAKGIMYGFSGLIWNEITDLTLRSVGDIIQRGGTFLKTSRCDEFLTDDGQLRAVEVLRRRQIDGVVAIGGDGTLRGALALTKHGIQTIGVPATIDNDIACTSACIGYDTALNTVLDAINKIRDTATSHERIFIIEVMGRDSGAIALEAGLAGGAEVILVPECPVDLDQVCSDILIGRDKGKKVGILIVAEGVMNAQQLGEEIRRRVGLENRVTVLGHIQRGGGPTAVDRLLASRMGAMAVDLLLLGETGKMTAFSEGSLRAVDLETALSSHKKFDFASLELARILSM